MNTTASIRTGWLPVLLASSALAVGLATPAPGQTPPYMPTTLAPIVDEALPAVVNISSTRVVRTRPGPFSNDPFFNYFFGHRHQRRMPQERREQSLGSGVIISEDGYVVTNNHVIQNGTEVQVYWDDQVFDADIVGRDQKTDVALLKMRDDGPFPHLDFADSDRLRVGDFVIAIGNPFGLDRTVTMGIVSAVGRADMGIADYEDFIQTDAAINPGNSGGALINLEGDLVGVNTAILSRSGGYQGIGFAIPATMASGVVESLREHGEVRRGWVGLVTQDLTQDLARAFGLERSSGVLISDVFQDGPADRAGVRQGDLVLAVNGRPVSSSAQYRSRTERFLPGMDATLTVYRDGAEHEILVPIERVPEESAAQAFDLFESAMIPGLALQTLDTADARRLGYDPRFRGVLVTDVADGSVAGERGIRPGDVIREVARVRVGSMQDLESVLDRVRGDQLLLLVQRGRQAYYVALPNPR